MEAACSAIHIAQITSRKTRLDAPNAVFSYWFCLLSPIQWKSLLVCNSDVEELGVLRYSAPDGRT